MARGGFTLGEVECLLWVRCVCLVANVGKVGTLGWLVWVNWCNHSRSVVILAFVKSEGKVTVQKPEVGGLTEKSSLLGDGASSLEELPHDAVHHPSTWVCLQRRCCLNILRLQKAKKVVSSPASINSDPVTSSEDGELAGTIEDGDRSWVDKLGVWQKRLM